MSIYNGTKSVYGLSNDFKNYDVSLLSVITRGRTVLGQPISVSTQSPSQFASYQASEGDPQALQTMIWTILHSVNDSLGVSINGDNSYTTLDPPAVTVTRTESAWVVTFPAAVTGDLLNAPGLATITSSTTTDTGPITSSTSTMSTEPPTTFTTLSPSIPSSIMPYTNQSAPTNGTSPPTSNSVYRSVIVGPVAGTLSAFLLLLALFLCYRCRLLCFRGRPTGHNPPYDPWSGTSDFVSEKSTVNSMNEVQAFPPFDLGEPGPVVVTADDLEHLPSKMHTLGEIVAARTVTPPPPAAAAAHGSQTQKKPPTATGRKHARTISDTTVCSSALSDPFRTPPTRDEQTPNISQATFCSIHTPTNPHLPSDPLPPQLDPEADKSTTHNHFLSTAPPRSKSPTQPCPLIPSHVIPSTATDHFDLPRRPVVRRASSLSSTSTKSHHASEKFADAETLYIGKARPMNLQSLRRHSLAPRIVNIMTHRTCSTVFEPRRSSPRDDGGMQPLNGTLVSGRARSVSPVRSVRLSGASAASLYSGSPAKLGRYFDIHSHSHGRDYDSSRLLWGRFELDGHGHGEGEGEGEGYGGQRKKNGASRAYNQIVADINR